MNFVRPHPKVIEAEQAVIRFINNRWEVFFSKWTHTDYITFLSEYPQQAKKGYCFRCGNTPEIFLWTPLYDTPVLDCLRPACRTCANIVKAEHRDQQKSPAETAGEYGIFWTWFATMEKRFPK